MKRFAVLLLALAMLLTCTACVGAQTTPSAASTTAATTAPETTEATTAPTTEPAAEPTGETASEEVKEAAMKDDTPYTTTSEDGLVTITLPNPRWTELDGDDYTILFSDGDCAITVSLYKTTDKLPTMPSSDDTHKLIFTSTVSTSEYVLLITGYAHEETDAAAISTAMNSIRVDKSKVPAQEAPKATPSYTVQDTSYSAWVTASSLNVRSASGTDASIIASLPKNTKVTVTGNVLENGSRIGWNRIKMSNGSVGFVASQFLTTSEPKSGPSKTGNSKSLWSQYGTKYTVYEYSDYTWKTSDGTSYWPDGFSTWINAAGKVLYDYDPTYIDPVKPSPSKTGTTATLYDSYGNVYTVYWYSDNAWRSDSGTEFWPDGFSTWKSATGKTFYDYDPTYIEPVEEPTTPTAPSDWKETFEASLYAHDGMVVGWYTYIGEGQYEAYVYDPDNPDSDGTVYVNSYSGSWNWA